MSPKGSEADVMTRLAGDGGSDARLTVNYAGRVAGQLIQPGAGGSINAHADTVNGTWTRTGLTARHLRR